MVKNKPIYVCDGCSKEMKTPYCETSDVPNEGSSEIKVGKRTFNVGGQHYCSLDCLFKDIRSALER